MSRPALGGALGVLAWLIQPPATAADLLIQDTTVVSPQLDAPLDHRDVLIRDGRIVEIGAHPLDAAAQIERLDGTGRYLVPGITDGHVHVSDVPGLPPDAVHGPAAADHPLAGLREAYVAQQPRSYLYFGVTQVVDPSNVPTGIAAFQAQPDRPDLFRCGSTMPLDGYPSVFVPPPARYALMPDWIYEPANADAHPLPPGTQAGAHTPEAVVQRIADSGAICVKLFIEDGFGGASDWPVLSAQTLARLRSAVDHHGLLLMTHANALDTQALALEVPSDILAHGVWNWGEVDGEPGVPAPVMAHLRRVKATGTGYQPTLRVMAGLAELFDSQFLDDPRLVKVVPPALLDWYRSDAGGWYRQQLAAEFGGAPPERIAAILRGLGDQGSRAAAALYEMGHPLLLGSDTPSGPVYANQPGYDTYREMRLLAEAGIPPAEIFIAATLGNARAFGLADRYGSVEVGKTANLLLLRANPRDAVAAWDSLATVILGGRPLARAQLAAAED